MDIHNPSDTAADTRRLRFAFTVALSFALLLWVLKLAEYLSGLEFIQFGIYPRRASGLAGVLSAPLIHGSVSHLRGKGTHTHGYPIFWFIWKSVCPFAFF